MTTSQLKVQQLVYDDGVIAVAMVLPTDSPSTQCMAIRWLKPHPYTGKDGRIVQVTNHMGGETDWFVVPFTLAAAMGRSLVEQKAAGLAGFDTEGFAALVRWLVEDEELHDSMCY
jgi:hypothetical protein